MSSKNKQDLIKTFKSKQEYVGICKILARVSRVFTLGRFIGILEAISSRDAFFLQPKAISNKVMLKQLMKLTKKKFGNREVRDLLSHAAFEQLFLTMKNKSSTPKSTALKFFLA